MHKLLKHLLFYCLLSTAYCLLLNAYPPGWSDDIQLSPVDMKSRGNPDVDVDGYNNVWAVWDTATWSNGTAEILYSKRDSLGNGIIEETPVSNNPSYSVMPCVVVDATNNVHFVWRDESPQGFGLWYAKLANDGTEIVPSHLAVSGAGGLGMYLESALSKYQDINIAWTESPAGYNQLNYTKLDSLGNPIITKIQITPAGVYAYWEGIGVDSFANNHLACRTDSGGISDRLTYSKLDKDGNILIANKVLAQGGNNAITSDRSQNIHIVYTNPTGPGNRIDYLKLDQSGNVLIGPKTISTPEIMSNTYADIAIDTLQYLHVVWQADSLGLVCFIMYCKLDTMGNYVIPPMKIVYPPYTLYALEPRIAVDHNNRLHVVWMNNRTGDREENFYKRGENETTVQELQKLKRANLPKIYAFPNPFSKETKIVFSVSRQRSRMDMREETKKTKIEIFNVIGRKVKEFVADGQGGVILWQGTDNGERYLPNGVYFIHVSCETNTQTISVVLLR